MLGRQVMLLSLLWVLHGDSLRTTLSSHPKFRSSALWVRIKSLSMAEVWMTTVSSGAPWLKMLTRRSMTQNSDFYATVQDSPWAIIHAYRLFKTLTIGISSLLSLIRRRCNLQQSRTLDFMGMIERKHIRRKILGHARRWHGELKATIGPGKKAVTDTSEWQCKFSRARKARKFIQPQSLTIFFYLGKYWRKQENQPSRKI